jgi:hypothetical protein
MMLHFLKETAKESFFTGLAEESVTKKKDQGKTGTQG